MPAFLFAPGAGAPSTHPWMQRWAGLLRGLGEVALLDYPYMLEKRARPDPLPRLVAAHAAALKKFQAAQREPVVLIGKSMGARIGCHVALDHPVPALVCLGYPLCGGGDRAKLRDQVLLKLKAPVLFIQGTRDPLCPLDLLETVRARTEAPTQLEIVEGGDHSLAVTKRQLAAAEETQADVEARLIRIMAEFLRQPPSA